MTGDMTNNTPKELFKIDHQSRLPLYYQIERNLRDLIAGGSLAEGEAVPSEWELAGLYGVSRLTVRRALDDLVRQSWLSRRQGVGTFVTRPAVASIAPAKLSFTEQMRSIGRVPSSTLISNRVIPANHKMAASLQLQEGDPLIEITRLRCADGVPILLETVYISQRRFPALEGEKRLAGESLYALLKSQYNVSITGMDQTLKPVLVNAQQARLLQVRPGSPAIASEIVAFSSAGEPVETSFSVASGEKSEFYFRFRRGEEG
jgi:GntR family transcriptional regulator